MLEDDAEEMQEEYQALSPEVLEEMKAEVSENRKEKSIGVRQSAQSANKDFRESIKIFATEVIPSSTRSCCVDTGLFYGT